MDKSPIEKLEELSKTVPVHEDNHWIYFGYGQGWGNKCDRCFKELEKGQPGQECINCWKFEIWIDNLTDVTAALVYLLEAAEEDHTLHGKLMKSPGLIFEPQRNRLGTGISHTIPEEAKPDRYLRREINQDRVILIYSETIEERDRRMKKIIGDLKHQGLYKKDLAPYRRGCIQPHERIIGPWEKWFDLDKDYPKE